MPEPKMASQHVQFVLAAKLMMSSLILQDEKQCVVIAADL
jgi:hypothetical protein